MDGFDALWEHSIGVISSIKLVLFWGQTLQNYAIMDMRVYQYQLFQNRAYNAIKCSLLANIKLIYGVAIRYIKSSRSFCLIVVGNHNVQRKSMYFSLRNKI